MRILLAEDDPLLGDALQTGPHELGFLVDWVRDGLAAERDLRAHPYTAAVLDLGLPSKDGTEVLAALRRARFGRGRPWRRRPHGLALKVDASKLLGGLAVSLKAPLAA